eukprot:9475448-Pyramimonas_sp.AAC.2
MRGLGSTSAGKRGSATLLFRPSHTPVSVEINVSTVCIEDGLRPLLDAQESPANCLSGRGHGRATEPLLEGRLRLLSLGCVCIHAALDVLP